MARISCEEVLQILQTAWSNNSGDDAMQTSIDIIKGLNGRKEADMDVVRIKHAIDTVKHECYIFSLTNFDRMTMVNKALDLVLDAARRYIDVMEERNNDAETGKTN